MRIDVTGGRLGLSEDMRAVAVRRVLLSLSRFGAQVQRVSVRLAEPANRLGGVDRRCRMRACLEARDDVNAEAINGRMEAAIGRAAVRLAKSVAWALDGDARTRVAPSEPRAAVRAHRRARSSE